IVAPFTIACGDDAEPGADTDASTTMSTTAATSASASAAMATTSGPGPTGPVDTAGAESVTGTESDAASTSSEETDSEGTTGEEEIILWYVPDSITQLCVQLDDYDATDCPEVTGNHPGQDGDYAINVPAYTASNVGGD